MTEYAVGDIDRFFFFVRRAYPHAQPLADLLRQTLNDTSEEAE